MSTFTTNHIFLSALLQPPTGVWLGETISWGWRVGYDVGGLQSGLYDLKTFDVDQVAGTRAVTLASQPMHVTDNWVGHAATTGHPQVTQADIDFLAGTMATFYATCTGRIGNTYGLTQIKVYAVDNTGHSKAGPNTYTPDTSPWMGSAGTILTPEVAMCVSLYSSERSKRGRGRFYFGPIQQAGLTGDGLWQTAYMTTVGGAVKVAFDATRARAVGGDTPKYGPIIWSRLNKVQGCAVNRIRIGDEPDHHETRTKSRPETFTDYNLV